MNKTKIFMLLCFVVSGLIGGLTVADFLEFEDVRLRVGIVVGYAIFNTIAIYVSVAIWQSMVKWLRS